MKSKKNERTNRRSAAPQRATSIRLRFEALEDRRLLAGMPELLKDIAVGANGSTRRTTFVEVGSVAYFSADDGVNGIELWKSDGTQAGTVLVKDIRPGLEGVFPNERPASARPSQLTNVNGTLYFRANDGTNGYELWKSNGTAAGTVLVKDIRSGSDSSIPGSFTNVNGGLFFIANDGTSGYELWKSNGAAAGTVRVKDINPGTSGSGIGDYSNVNGMLYFTANDGTTGTELWKTNGTDAGTVLVKDVRTGPFASFPGALTNVNGTLFFTASNGTSYDALWKSNGTAGGTVLVKDIRPGNLPSTQSLTNFNGTLFFNANDGTSGRELWKSDGTTSGTVLFKDINPGTTNLVPNSSGADTFIVVSNTLFFTADDGTSGGELWKSDGTVTGTSRVKDIASGILSSDIRDLENVGGLLYFSGDDGASGRELWSSNGTEAGTVLVSDINPGSLGSMFGNEYSMSNVAGTLYFSAVDVVNGQEPRVLRPTVATSLAIAATSANKNEGNSGSTAFTFTVTRSGALTGTTTVNYAVTGIGANPATASDFIGNALPSGSVTFTAGQTSKVISIRVRGDVSIESNETFRVTLSGPTGGATITTATANETIRNDDVASLAIAATSANKVEGNSGFVSFTFTVTRTGATAGTTTVDYAVVGSGANPANASDFFGLVLPSGQITFAAGETTKLISIRVRGDAAVERDERFSVTLSSTNVGTNITTSIASGLIRNDDN